MKWLLSSVCILFLFNSCENQEIRHVEYVISGTSEKYNVIYDDENETVQREDEVKVGWLYSFNARQSQFLYVSAENPESTGEVTVTILVDGKKFKSATEFGGYKIATASGTIQ